MLDTEILDALREGRRLCPQCLGLKQVRWTGLTDFGPLKKLSGWMECEACNGIGLEPESVRENMK